MMPTFAANLSMMFTEWSFLDRFAAAADAGFKAVEFLFPYEHSPDDIHDRLTRARLTQALFNLPPGDWANGERGIAAFPHRAEEFTRNLSIALPYAQATNVQRLHMMAGLAPSADPAAQAAYRSAALKAAAFFAPHGVDILLEPINSQDMPGYFLNSFDAAVALIEEAKAPNLRLQFDIYHRQIMHGDVTRALRKLLPITGHIQIAGVPARHEPDDNELNYPFLFRELDALGYVGYVGCEYRPKGATLDGLGWFRAYSNT
jgi:hydroxypyruvate isomerase